MPYIQRNEHGEVTGLTKEPGDSSAEFLTLTHPDVVAFLAEGTTAEEENFSPLTDLEMVRVIEDLVDLLIARNVIILTDFPAAVQKKLLRQRNRRARLFGGVSVVEDGENSLF